MLEIMILWHLKRAVPRPKVMLFMTKKKPVSLKQADLRDMFKKTSKSVCTSTVLVSPDPMFLTTTQENTKEDLDDPELADERDIQMEYTSN
jgi:hypothetical protein